MIDLVAGKADLPGLAFRALPTVDKALGEVVEDGLSRHADCSGCTLYRVGSIRPARRIGCDAVDHSLLDEPAQERIRALAADFPRIWNDERTGAVERKRMLGLLIEDVTLLVDEQVNIHIRWRGGRTQSLSVARPRPMSVIRKTPAQVVALMNALLETDNDQQIAARLNELGHRNWRGEPFTLKKVMLPGIMLSAPPAKHAANGPRTHSHRPAPSCH
ncbi:hypothetical protein [Mesorhizobium sp.]|uniref:hypothetical protein n=1 Tax=Mesorhizobium sp. TaxID=1871066 RepID=UPI00257B332A|nr:hypothetical protein [Mesorhizobium sp.]